MPKPPSGWIGDFHSLVNKHARHTRLVAAGAVRAQLIAIVILLTGHFTF